MQQQAKASLLEQCCQTKHGLSDNERTVPDTSVDELRKLVENKDKHLIAQMHEVDRLSQEMRLWQRKAAESREEVASMSHALAAAKEELKCITLASSESGSSSKEPNKKTRMEPYVSQIPISVKQVADQYKKLGDSRVPGSGGFFSPQGSVPAYQGSSAGSVHTAGSSLSSLPSYLPRPVGEKSQFSGTSTWKELKAEEVAAEEASARTRTSSSTGEERH